MIRKATREDIDNIIEMTKACATHMISLNIFQWNEIYPSENTFLKDLERHELYVLEHQNKIIGSITISSLMDKEYIPIQWLTNNINNVYIHRLAVHPNQQGHGYAQKLMTFAEKLALKNNNISLRLDTFSQNQRNQNFYEMRGYKRLGEIYFPKQSEHPFYCYELVL